MYIKGILNHRQETDKEFPAHALNIFQSLKRSLLHEFVSKFNGTRFKNISLCQTNNMTIQFNFYKIEKKIFFYCQ